MFRTFQIAVIATAASILTCCKPAPKLPDNNEIRVVIFEWLIRGHSDSSNRAVWFVTLNADEKRLLRSRVNPRNDIRDASQAKSVPPRGSIVDKTTGEAGVALEIHSVSIKENYARVRAGCFSGNLNAAIWDFDLVKESQWKVVNESLGAAF